jgi:hypothetical protein
MRLRMILGMMLLVAISAGTAIAARYNYGTQRVNLPPQYGTEMNELVNDPARSDGHSLLAHFEFNYSGDAKTLNKFIAKYAKLEHAHVYLTVGPNSGPLSLQLRHHTDRGHSLTVHLDESFSPDKLELPDNVPVEVLPPVSESLDPKRKAAEAKLWEQVQAIAKKNQKANGKRADHG